MCGRYTFTDDAAAQIDTWLGATWLGSPARASYNIAPTQHAPICRLDEDGARVLEMYRWGLIPSWAKDASIGARTINARSETAASKPSFRAAFRARRCLVPASGYYEWMQSAGGKQPHWTHPVAGGLLAFAGLWERWQPDPDAEPVHSFTILTAPSNQDTRALHERMPVLLLDETDREAWLAPGTPPDRLQALLRTAPDGVLRHHAVDPRVGSPSQNDPDCILPFAEDERGAGQEPAEQAELF
jgi:putative SOS response-associated peptidase YedK